MYSDCSTFYLNRFTFSRVIAEHVNTTKTRHEVNPTFSWSLASSRITEVRNSKIKLDSTVHLTLNSLLMWAELTVKISNKLHRHYSQQSNCNNEKIQLSKFSNNLHSVRWKHTAQIIREWYVYTALNHGCWYCIGLRWAVCCTAVTDPSVRLSHSVPLLFIGSHSCESSHSAQHYHIKHSVHH